MKNDMIFITYHLFIPYRH